MTSRLIGRFVLAVERATRERHGPGPLRRYEADLVVPDDTRAECAVLKAVAEPLRHDADERVVLNAPQRDVVAELVEAYAADPTTGWTRTSARDCRRPATTGARCGSSSTRWRR